MIPPRCYTCGKPLLFKEFEYVKFLQQLEKKNLSEKELRSEKHKYLKSLNLKRYCCKMQFMTTNPRLDKVYVS